MTGLTWVTAALCAAPPCRWRHARPPVPSTAPSLRASLWPTGLMPMRQPTGAFRRVARCWSAAITPVRRRRFRARGPSRPRIFCGCSPPTRRWCWSTCWAGPPIRACRSRSGWWTPGWARGFDDPLQAKLDERLARLTAGDRQRPVVFYCLSAECWLSYNASLRAVALGYRSVLWYRGGIEAWRAAGLPMAPAIGGW